MPGERDGSSEHLAGFIVDALRDIDVVAAADIPRASRVAAEEINVKKAVGDYWCSWCSLLPEPSVAAVSVSDEAISFTAQGFNVRFIRFGLLIRTGGLGWKSRQEHTALVGASRRTCASTTSYASSPACATHMRLKVRSVSPRFGAWQGMSSLNSGHTSMSRSVGICSRATVAMATQRGWRDPFAWTPRFWQGSNVTSEHLSMTPGARPDFRVQPSAARCSG